MVRPQHKDLSWKQWAHAQFQEIRRPAPSPTHTPVKPPSAPWGRASLASCPSASAVWNQFTHQTNILPRSEIEHAGPRGAEELYWPWLSF